jgi:hypothetical protein
MVLPIKEEMIVSVALQAISDLHLRTYFAILSTLPQKSQALSPTGTAISCGQSSTPHRLAPQECFRP